MSQKTPSRDWNAERAELAAAFAQLEMMKLWLYEHQQSALEFTKECEKLTARLSKFGEIDEEGMIDFRMGVDRQRWDDFTRACNIQAGRELSPAEVETRAFYLWSDVIDAAIKRYNVKENVGPVVLTIWANNNKNGLEFEVEEIPEPLRKRENDGPALMA